MTTPNPYDEVPYPTQSYSSTYPDRLWTQGILRGMNPAPAPRCRVLELGCGAGGNLIPMALSLPEATFLGIDLSAGDIERGQALLAVAGARNVTLQQGDICDLPAELGRFDYIVAHGLYTWVPSNVRDRLLAICDAHLGEQGIGFVSYTVFPGGHMRHMVREMLRYHARSGTTSQERLAKAKELLAFLANGSTRPERYREILKEELTLMGRFDGHYYFHDNLAEINHPVYFHEFVEHARRHRLQYLTDLNCSIAMDCTHPPEVLAELRRLSGGERTELEQYGDFFDCRLFRQTLLCRETVALDADFDPRRVSGLFARSAARPVSSMPNLRSEGIEKFRGVNDATIETALPLAKAALTILSERYPQPILFPELLAASKVRLGSPPDTDPQGRTLAEFLHVADAMQVVRLSGHDPTWTTTVSERPLASPAARWQSAVDLPLTNIWHHPIRMEDPLLRHVLTLLDGTRNMAALVDEVTAFMQAKGMFLKQGEQPITDPAQVRQLLTAALPSNIEKFARMYLLIG